MKPAVKAAVDVIMRELGGYEARAMGGEAAPGDTDPAVDEAPGADVEDCPECAAGTCDNPEHMDEGSKAAILKELGA